MITIKGRDYTYDENQVVNFAEGLIGMPEMRRAVLMPMEDMQPFCWLASLESDGTRFIVMDPVDVFVDYRPFGSEGDAIRTFAIVKVSSDWKKTTVNLRAPLVIDTGTASGSQVILNDSDYQFAEAMIQN